MPRAVRQVITLGTPFTGHPQGHQRLAPLRDRHRPQDRRAGNPCAAARAAARADDVHLQPHRRRRRLAVQRREARARAPRTSRSRPATSGSASTRWRGMRSPTGSRSPRAMEAVRSRRALRWLYRDPAQAGSEARMPHAVDANGITLDFETAGEPGAPVVLLIMGLGMHWWPGPTRFVDGLVSARLSRDPLRQPRLRPLVASCARPHGGRTCVRRSRAR